MKTKLPVHAFAGDGITDPLALRPVECCTACGLPKANPRHQLPAVSAESQAAEARRIGERS